MTMREELDRISKNQDTVPVQYHITKIAESSLMFFADQAEMSESKTLELLLNYCSTTPVCLKILEDLNIKFDPSKI